MTDHPTDSDCIFCKIVAGEIPCFKLYEDDATLAFMDVNPANPGHALAVAKGHWETLYAIPGDVAGKVVQTAQRVATAVNEALSPDGINLAQANGPGAAQSVPHFHIHVLPRREGDNLGLNWGHQPGDMDEIKKVYEKVLAAMP
jgi:histidine triad (HIT) family protein